MSLKKNVACGRFLAALGMTNDRSYCAGHSFIRTISSPHTTDRYCNASSLSCRPASSGEASAEGSCFNGSVGLRQIPRCSLCWAQSKCSEWQTTGLTVPAIHSSEAFLFPHTTDRYCNASSLSCRPASSGRGICRRRSGLVGLNFKSLCFHLVERSHPSTVFLLPSYLPLRFKHTLQSQIFCLKKIFSTHQTLSTKPSFTYLYT